MIYFLPHILGLLDKIEDGKTFLALSFTLRIIEANSNHRLNIFFPNFSCKKILKVIPRN